jgi:hypothetical protein
MGNEKVNEKLEFIFQNTNEWLKFAETKNGILLGIIITTSAFLIENKTNLKNNLGVCLFISLIISLLSFFPQNTIKFFNLVFMLKSYLSKNKEKNLLYFQDIINFTKEQYLIKILNKYFSSDEINDNYALDLTEEIIINSRICYIKLFCFKISLLFFIFFLINLFFSIKIIIN